MRHTRSLLSFLGSLLLALVLATIIWINATQVQDPIRSQFIQLEVDFVGQSEDSILVRPERQSVQIRIEWPESTIRQISPDNFAAFVDLRQVPFGQSVSVPIEITSTVPDLDRSLPIPEEVEVLLEQQVSREIPVELDIRGDVARGHVQGEPLIEPATISVSGPASLVEQLDFALATVFLNDVRETTFGEHRPIFYDEQGRVASTTNLDLNMEEVQVTIPVEESDGFADKLITIDWEGYPAPGYRLLNASVDPPSVLVTGLPARINAMTRLKTEPIDITGLTGTFNQQVTLDLPAGVSLDQDQEIFVTIEVEPILSTDTHERNVELLGLREDMQASIDPEQVRVVLFGPLPALDSLVADDVRVTVDLFELISGTHRIQPVVDLPERGIEVRSIRPETISVTISRTITPTDEITSTLPVTETNNALLMIVARTKLNADISTTSTIGTATLPVAQPFLSHTLKLTHFADIPGKRTIA